ncbi:SCO family protein [Maricaulis sp. CAU 1757]
MPRPVLWILIAAPVVMMLTFLTLMLNDARNDGAAPAPTRVSGEADIGGPFTLVDHTGSTVTEADFRGRPMLVLFGYTWCPDVCPFSLQVMDAALGQLDAEDQGTIQPILVTVDPERDTVEQMASYVASPAFPDGLVGLTGSLEQVDAMASTYRVAVRRNNEEGGEDYLVDHSSLIYLMDSEGDFVDVFSPQADPREIAARLQHFLDEDV